MLPAVRPPRSPSAAANADSTENGATSVHTQLGSSGSLAQRFCISRNSPLSPAMATGSNHLYQQDAPALAARDHVSGYVSESDAVSPSAGGASVHRSMMNQMPVATNLFARLQQQHEKRDEHHLKQHNDASKMSSGAAAAAAAAAETADGIHHHLLNERVTRLESAVATLATTVSQLVQLLSAAAESSPQAAAAIWSTAAQLSAEIPAALASKSGGVQSPPASGMFPADTSCPQDSSRRHTPPRDTRVAIDSPSAAFLSDETLSLTNQSRGIAAPEFNLRHKIVRVADLHERLCSLPSGLPAHESVRVTRQ
jgi:hypothetical protein